MPFPCLTHGARGLCAAMRLLHRLVVAFVLTVISAQASPDPDLGDALHWRNIGPYRGGRVRAICGVPSQPSVFYMAPVNGGVFKTNDYGRTWQPIFDDQPTGSIGAIAVAPSDPNIVYVGSGEGLHRPDLSVGDGVYKSTDAGKTWRHLGLGDGQQIAQLAIDPKNPDRVFVAVAGHPYGPNEERGIFCSTDGGKHFEKILYQDENTSGQDVQIDPSNPQIVYATLWEVREGPWENGAWSGTNGGIFKSIDGGTTWKQLTPTPDIVQANIAIAPSAPKTLLAAIATKKGAKLYRSDDGGETWKIASDDARPAARIGGGDLAVVRFDPTDANVVYSASVVCWKSIDSGKTWSGWRGAPGGDDYQNVWVNPNDPKTILLGSDQGAIVTVNGGETWSSWYNQSTAQLYHVSADNAFPYRLYSGQQESGSVGIASRGNDGAITFRDWHPVAAEEYGYVVADPLDPEIIYGGKLSRYDRRTGQAKEIFPLALRSPDFRILRTEPVVFSPVDPHLLFFAGNTLWQTRDGGENWTQISPDLTRKTYELPKSIGKYRDEKTAEAKQRGVIYAVAPSPLDVKRIWAGTDDGLIHLTVDGGKTWQNVTPPQLSAWQKISIIDAGHFDPDTAYVAVNALRIDDLRPHIFRTRDAGKTWQEIVRGIPDGNPVNVVREDPQRKGLLFAGTERAVYVSFDDGENWRSLRLNMPATSVRDLIVKDDDLAVATHGRGFWILDNITPLRQFAPGPRETALLTPQVATRVRWNINTDTPLPPDEPTGENPPDGAMIDYTLADTFSGEVVLEIKDAKGAVLRRYSSSDKIVSPNAADVKVPMYWLRPPQALSARPGLHRFLWDMHHAPLAEVEAEYPIAAIAHQTAPEATAPWAMPGQYSVALTANGQSFSKPLQVKMDPRIKATVADLQAQFALAKKLYEARPPLETIEKQLSALSEQVGKAKDGDTAELDEFANKLASFAPPKKRPGEPMSLDVLGRLRDLFGIIQGTDALPTARVQTAVPEVLRDADAVQQQWRKLLSDDLVRLNGKLEATGQKKLSPQP